MPKGRQKVDRLAVARANGWASQEDENLRKEGLRDGRPVPDLATIQDFIRFYIYYSNGMISLRATKSSVWISKGLVQEEVIEDIRRTKHMFTHCDLTNILVSLWTDDDPIFIHPRYRVQLTFAILIYCYTGARIGTFIPDTSKKDERGLRYEDIELYVYCRMDGEMNSSSVSVRNGFRIAMREHGKLRFNPVPWLLEMAVQDGAFLHLDSLQTLKTWNPDNNEPVPLLWKLSVAEEPVLRQVNRFAGISKRAWTRESFCRIFRAVITDAGYPEVISIHTLRRGLANRLDKVAADAERSQILTQKDPDVFGRSYVDRTSALSIMDAFLGEKMRLDHIEYLRGVGKYRAIGYPRHLPAERQHAIGKHKDFCELERRLKELRIQETSGECSHQSTVDESDADNVDDDASFAIKLTTKQIQVLKTRLNQSELAKAGGKTPETIVYNDVAHCLFKAQPDRQRIVKMMLMDDHLSYQDMLFVVESLLAYCSKDYDVFYRPGEEPVNGRCPVGNYCQHKERCKMLGCEETQLKYCYECFSFTDAEEWKDHCSWHLKQGMSRRTLSPPDRMRAWKRSNELRSHAVSHIKTMCGTYFESEAQLRYHLGDTHGLQKAIWDTCGDELDNQKKSSTRADAVSRGKKRSREWKGTKKRQRLGPREAFQLRIIQWASPESRLSHAQLAQHSHNLPSDRLVTPFRQYETLFSSVDGRPGNLCANESGSNAHGIECSTRSPSPQSDSILTTLDASDLSTLYTSDEPGPSTTITSPEILPIDSHLMQDCNSSSLDEHESEIPEDRDLSGPDPTTSPTSPMPKNGSSPPKRR
ncbi:hypothetical protein BDW68DRAFT_186264 [Aspergillus falconensis]